MKSTIKSLRDWLAGQLWRKRRLPGKIALVIGTLTLLSIGTMYGIAKWYMWTHRGEPTRFGATFIAEYARYYGLDPKQTMTAMVDDLGINHFRLVSYWEDIENRPGNYDFSGLDWQFRLAESRGATVSLAIGLRQPRWPECHWPAWAQQLPKEQWYPRLKNVMAKVIERYKTSPALVSYQLENEFFLSVFGECQDFDRQRLVDEFRFVKQQDPNHPVIISRSNNAVGWPVGQPTPDMYAVSVYKRVWDKTLTRRYFEYPFPAWFYGFLAGMSQLTQGRDMFIHELQTEAWLPEGFDMRTAPISEQNKSLSAERLWHRLEYGRATGMKQIDLWGVEWWYYRKTALGEPSLWQTAKDYIARHSRTADVQ